MSKINTNPAFDLQFDEIEDTQQQEQVQPSPQVNFDEDAGVFQLDIPQTEEVQDTQPLESYDMTVGGGYQPHQTTREELARWGYIGDVAGISQPGIDYDPEDERESLNFIETVAYGPARILAGFERAGAGAIELGAKAFKYLADEAGKEETPILDNFLEVYGNHQEHLPLSRWVARAQQARKIDAYEASTALGILNDIGDAGADLATLLLQMKLLGGVGANTPNVGIAKGIAYNQVYEKMARMGIHGFVTTPGDAADRAEAARMRILYNLTPYAANATGATGLTAVALDAGFNALLTSPVYREAIKQAGGLNEQSLSLIIPQMVMDIGMAWNTRGTPENIMRERFGEVPSLFSDDWQVPRPHEDVLRYVQHKMQQAQANQIVNAINRHSDPEYIKNVALERIKDTKTFTVSLDDRNFMIFREDPDNDRVLVDVVENGEFVGTKYEASSKKEALDYLEKAGYDISSTTPFEDADYSRDDIQRTEAEDAEGRTEAEDAEGRTVKVWGEEGPIFEVNFNEKEIAKNVLENREEIMKHLIDEIDKVGGQVDIDRFDMPTAEDTAEEVRRKSTAVIRQLRQTLEAAKKGTFIDTTDQEAEMTRTAEELEKMAGLPPEPPGYMEADTETKQFINDAYEYPVNSDLVRTELQPFIKEKHTDRGTIYQVVGPDGEVLNYRENGIRQAVNKAEQTLEKMQRLQNAPDEALIQSHQGEEAPLQKVLLDTVASEDRTIEIAKANFRGDITVGSIMERDDITEPEKLTMANNLIDAVNRVNEGNYVFHAGDLGKAEGLRSLDTGRDTGYFGTGTYFTSNRHKLKTTYPDRPIEIINLEGHNLYKPTFPKTLHDFLKNVNYYARGSDKFNRFEAEVDAEVLFDMSKEVLSERLEEAKAHFEQNWEGFYDTPKGIDSPPTVFMKGLGYDGIDVRGTDFDTTQYGTVVYDLNRTREYQDWDSDQRGSPSKLEQEGIERKQPPQSTEGKMYMELGGKNPTELARTVFKKSIDEVTIDEIRESEALNPGQKFILEKEKMKRESMAETEHLDKPRGESKKEPVPIQEADYDNVKHTEGTHHTIKNLNTGEGYQTEWALVEAGDIKTSHTTSFDINKNYPEEKQPRANRGEPASVAQIKKIYATLDPATLINDVSKIDGGPPVIDSRMDTLVGNARMIALKLLYEDGHKNSQTYKDYLKERLETLQETDVYGIDSSELDNYDNPVLVRVIRSENIDDLERLVQTANDFDKAARTNSETAIKDSSKIDHNILIDLNPNPDGDYTTAANNDFLKKMNREVFTTGELSALVDKDAGLTQQGLKRIQEALFYKAFPDIELLNEYSVATDQVMKNATKAMMRAAGYVAKYQDNIRLERYLDRDISAEIMNAANIYRAIKKSDVSLKQILDGENLFAKDADFEDFYELSNIERNILRYLEDNKRIYTNIRDFMIEYTKIGQEDLMSTTDDLERKKAPYTKAEMVKKAMERATGQQTLWERQLVKRDGSYYKKSKLQTDEGEKDVELSLDSIYKNKNKDGRSFKKLKKIIDSEKSSSGDIDPNDTFAKYNNRAILRMPEVMVLVEQQLKKNPQIITDMHKKGKALTNGYTALKRTGYKADKKYDLFKKLEKQIQEQRLKEIDPEIGLNSKIFYGPIKHAEQMVVDPEMVKAKVSELAGKYPLADDQHRIEVFDDTAEREDVKLVVVYERDANYAEKVLAHELGHLVDHLEGTIDNPIFDKIVKVKQGLQDIMIEKDNLKANIYGELLTLSAQWRGYNPDDIIRMAESSDAKEREGAKYIMDDKEVFADTFSAFLTAPEFFREKAPNSYKLFQQNLEQGGEFARTYEYLEAAMKVEGEINSMRAEGLIEGYREGLEVIEESQRDDRTTQEKAVEVKDYIFRNFSNKFHDLNKLIDPKLREISQGSEVDVGQEALLGIRNAIDRMGLVASGVEQYYYEQLRTLNKVLEAGIDLDDIGLYAQNMRIIYERYDLANPKGMTETTAKEQLSELRAKYGEDKYNLLKENMEQFYDNRHAKIVTRADKAEYYNDNIIEVMKNNREYVNFTPAEYADNITAKIYEQTGTFKATLNPIQATLMKDAQIITAITINDAKKAAVKTLEMFDKSGNIKQGDAVYDDSLDRMIPKQPDGSDKGTMTVMQKGVPVTYEVPKTLADAFDRTPTEASKAMKLMSLMTMPSKALYVSLNWGWAVANVPRDLGRTIVNNPEIGVKDIPKLLSLWKESFKETIKDIHKGERSEDLAYLKENMVIPIHKVYNANEYTSIEELNRLVDGLTRSFTSGTKLQEFDVTRRFFSGIKKLEMPGQISEVTNKLASFKMLKEQGMTDAQAEHRTRIYSSTPYFGNRGKFATFLNNMFLYYGVRTEGFVSYAKSLARNPADVMFKTAMLSVVAKSMQFGLENLTTFMPGEGAEEIEEIMDGASEYHKENYLVIPVRMSDSGNAVYMTLPMPFVLDTISRSYYNALNGNFGRALGAIASTNPINPGSFNPVLNAAKETFSFVAGENIWDSYRQKTIFDRTEMALDRKDRAGTFFRHQFNQLGGRAFINLTGLENSDTLASKAFNVFPLNALNRFVRVNKSGYYQDVYNIYELAEQYYAKNRMNEERSREGKEPLEITRQEKEARAARNRIYQIRRTMTSVENSNLPDEEKKQRIELLENQMINIARETLGKKPLK